MATLLLVGDDPQRTRERTMIGVKTRGWDHLLGIALCIGYVALLLHTSRGLAMTRDESFYVVAAERYGTWLKQLWEDPTAARTPEAIDAAWRYNNEHPPLAKTLFAVSWLAQQKWHVFPLDSMAYRFPGMLFGGLFLWLIYIFGAQAAGRRVGAFAALAHAVLPQPYYHAHLDCFDVPIAFMLTLTVYAYWRSLRSVTWTILCGVVYGLALATKHNAWVLPGVLFIHWVWMALHERAARRRGAGRQVYLAPWWLLSMAVLGPAIFIGSWPWLWRETTARFREYAAFHMNHIHYDIEYFGENLFRPPFPIHYPFVMTLFTITLTTLVLFAVGLALRSRALLPTFVAERLWPNGAARADARFTDVLWFGAFFAPIFVIAWPTTPVFGGTKHWMAAFPFLVLFAGIGFDAVVRVALDLVPSLPSFARGAVASTMGAVLLLPAAADTAHGDKFGLSIYTSAAGGVPGAADWGMNRQFWGFTTGSLASWFTEHLPRGGTIWLCDQTWDSWRMLQRDGYVPSNITPAPDAPSADYAIVHHELHFNEVDYQIWQAYGTTRPVHVLTFDGVPIISVYENPHRRAR